MMAPTVDILLATYNGEQFLKEQIESILGQTYENFRLIIRDDGSTDGTAAIIESYAKRYPSKIYLLPCDARLGIKGNFSALMASSKANYILFADQDDVWERQKVELTLKKMQAMETDYSTQCPLLVHTDLKVVDGSTNVISLSFWEYSNLKPIHNKSLGRLLIQNVVTGCATMVNRPLLQLAYPVPDGGVMHDWWLALVAAAFGQIGEVPEATVLYRQHGKNALGAKKAKKMWSYHFMKRAIQKALNIIPIGKDIFERDVQAKELLKRYPDRLDEKQKALINAYLKLSSTPLGRRSSKFLKCRLYMMGLLNNFQPLCRRIRG